jgi:peptidoglycan/xylan/chitin deacetylase (PgdA/CDA1 family)
MTRILVLYCLILLSTHSRSWADNSLLLSSGPTDKRLVALTFDDGPKPERITPILDILDRYQVKASFFVVGKMAEKNPDLVLRMTQSGDDVCNHSYSHPNLKLLSSDDVRLELSKTSDIIEKVTGSRPRFFRPPGGNYDDSIVTTAGDLGMTTALWNINAEDFTYIKPLRDLGAPPRESFNRHSDLEIHELVMRHVRNGSIILFHAGGPETQRALPKLITELKAKGFQLVTLSELVGMPSQYSVPARY